MRSSQSRPLGRLNEWICCSCQVRLAGVRSSQRSFTTSKTSASSVQRPAKVPESPARTRFAPSPTGDLHLGSIRTALFNYLLARRTGGQFLLRIEDTDQKRTIPGAEERLFRDLRWAGLQWDEGPEVGGSYGPYRQSERIDVYQKHIHPLLQSRKAYRCFCSAERIDNLNRMRHEKGLPLGYDRKCIDISVDEANERANRGEAHVIRFKVPDPYPKITDIVYGKTGHGTTKGKKHQFDEPVYDDPILLKTDGFPTYHFANVVDDQLMQITHVIRGSEWMSSTPLHVALYDAFGWKPPIFGHVPLLVDENRQKLSKRNFDTSISSYRDKGYYPDAVINFAALLGWSHQQKSDVMDLSELEAIFDLKFTKGNTIVSFDKLRFLQEQHARRRVEAGGEVFEQMIRDVAVAILNKYGARSVVDFVGKRKLRNVLASMLQVRSLPCLFPSEFAAQVSIFFDDSHVKARPAFGPSDPSVLRNLRIAASTLLLVPEESWTSDVHRANLGHLDISPSQSDAAAIKECKKELYHFLRWALLGGVTGPSVPETMEILGRSTCEARIKEAALVLQELENKTSKPQIGEGITKKEEIPDKRQMKGSWEKYRLPEPHS